MQNRGFPLKLKKILNFSFLIVFKFHRSIFRLKKPKFYSDGKTGNIYLNLYYLNILLLGSKTWGNCSLFLLLEIIITTLIIPHFQIHQFPVGRLIFIIRVWPVQSTVPCRIFFCVSVHLLVRKTKQKKNPKKPKPHVKWSIRNLRRLKKPHISLTLLFVCLEIKYQNRASSSLKLNTVYLIGYPIANNLNTLKIKVRFIQTSKVE